MSLVEADALPASGEELEDQDHDCVQYDLADWDADQRRGLELLLIGRNIPYGWEGFVLTVPHAREGEADDLIDEIDERAAPEGLHAEATDDLDEVEFASSSRRLVGALADSLILGFAALPLERATLEGDPTVRRLLLLAATAAYFIVATAVWGRTLGKVAAGTKVVGSDDLAVPTWPRSALRWVVPALPTLATIAAAPTTLLVALLLSVYSIVVYRGVLWDSQGRGLHDRAAGTIVIRTPVRAARRLEAAVAGFR